MIALTVFEMQVLEAIKQIPAGRVSTYRAVACAIGKPRAVRAVGQALHKNPFLVTVPCHRIVRSDGTIGGYREGNELKQKILAREGITFDRNRVKNFESVLYRW